MNMKKIIKGIVIGLIIGFLIGISEPWIWIDWDYSEFGESCLVRQAYVASEHGGSEAVFCLKLK